MKRLISLACLLAFAGIASAQCIPSGVTDQYTYFVAVDSGDFTSRETGLSSFTVYRSRNGGAAAAFTTPTINETDSSNMPGVYELLLDEDMTIDAGDDVQHMALHITHAGMAPVTKEICIARAKVTAGETLTVSSGSGNAAVQTVANNAITAAAIATGAVDADAVANGAIDAGAFAADVDAEILSYLVDDATRIDASALNTASSRVATALPNAAPAGNGGLPTVNASNYVAGIAGTLNTLDALDTAQDSQHSATQGLVTTVDGNVDAVKAVTDTITVSNGLVEVDVQAMNGAEVLGDGTSGDKWRGE